MNRCDYCDSFSAPVYTAAGGLAGFSKDCSSVVCLEPPVRWLLWNGDTLRSYCEEHREVIVCLGDVELTEDEAIIASVMFV
jgi:hypothetical protein